MTEVDIEIHLPQIRKMAKRALGNMKKPTTYTFDDMVQEGIMVLLKDAAPHHYPKGHQKYRANFKSFLTVCLRNHFVGMMKTSFKGQPKNEEEEKNAEIAKMDRMRTTNRGEQQPDDMVSYKLLLESLDEILTGREKAYLNLLLKDISRKEVRGIIGISFPTESKLRKNIRKKVGKLMGVKSD